MNKPIIITLAALCLAAGTLGAQSNLLRNGGFETDLLGQLAFWQVDSFRDTDDARRVFVLDAPTASGKRSLAIVNLIPNDTRVVQWLDVEPDSFYRITCRVLAESVAGGNIGANISVPGSITPSPDAKDTSGTWAELSLTGKTGPDQTFLAVALRLGFYDNLVMGRAYFDDARAEKISTPPAGAKVVDFSSNRGAGVLKAEVETAPARTEEINLLYVILSVLAGALLLSILFIALLARRNHLRVAAAQAEAAAGRKTIGLPDLRRFTRKSLHVSIVVRKALSNDNYKLIELKSVNISSVGLLLSSDDLSLFSVGERLELTAVYKRKKYDLGAARVVRKQETHPGAGRAIRTGFGLAFMNPSPAQAKNINILLA